jgi:predicted nucleic acid-binding protein
LYVVDASAIAQYFVQDSFTVYAEALFQEVESFELLYIPEFCRLECINVIWKYARFRTISAEQAEELTQNVLKIPFSTISVEPLYLRALQVGLKHQLAIYDSIYIALAENLNFPLITLDERQSKAAIAENVIVKRLTEFQPSSDSES